MTEQNAQGGSAPLRNATTRNAKWQDVREALGLPKHRMKVLWKQMPHTYIGNLDKRRRVDLARFDLGEVTEWMRGRTA